MKQVRKCSGTPRWAAAEVLQCPRRMHVEGAVDAPEETRIQPVPPSDRAILRSLLFLIGADHSRSAAALTMFIGCSVIITSGGESTAGIDSLPDDPMCTHITVSVDESPPDRIPVVRSETRIAQCSRVFGECQRMHALLGIAADLLGAQLGVPDHRQSHRDEPARMPPHHSSMCQSLQACTSAREKSESSVANRRAAKPGKDGKFMPASTPPAFMS